MAGFPTDRGTVDATLGQGVLNLREAFDKIVRIDAWLDARNDAELTALGYDQAEITTIRSAYNALAKLAAVAKGQDTVTAQDNFFFHAKNLVGLN